MFQIQRNFNAPMRNIFKSQVISFYSGKESRTWLNKPNINHWPQQLNMAVWCATSGCGVSLIESLNYPKVISSFIKFHVYFTIRRILYEMRLPLPGEQTFSLKNNPYNKLAYNRLCAEFGLSNNQDFKGLNKPLADFRWKGGANAGLGDVYINYGKGYIPPGEVHGKGGGDQNVRIIRNYDPKANIWPSESAKFSDDGGKKIDGNLISLLRNIEFADFKYAWFIPESGYGLTKAGLGRLNRSVEAFVYCILGAQVNTRNPIYENGGGAGGEVETQQEFLALFESSVIENDISNSVKNYQQSVYQTKLRLDLAVAPGVWLMPSNMIINTESVVGYNNKLMKATEDMKFGINNSLNTETKTVGISHSLGSSKVFLEHKTKTKQNPITTEKDDDKIDEIKTENNDTTQHQSNLILFMVLGGALSWFLFR